MTLDEAARGRPFRITEVGGDRSFRRRLMELGLVPGTEVRLLRVAPLGDPVELEARGCCLSIRRAEARGLRIAAAAPRALQAATASTLAEGAVVSEAVAPATTG